MKNRQVMDHNKKSTALTLIGVTSMILLTVTKVVPSSNIAGYSVLVGIAFFFITESVAKTQDSESGLRLNTIVEDIKKPGVLAWMLLPSVSGIVTLIVGNMIFSGGFVAHVMGRTGSILSFDKTILLIGQVIIAAFGEEIAYRGFFFGKTLKLFPIWVCAVVSSAVFAAGHIAAGNTGIVVYDIAAVFIDSLIFSVIYHKSGNCVISTLSHILGNSISIVAVFVFFLSLTISEIKTNICTNKLIRKFLERRKTAIILEKARMKGYCDMRKTEFNQNWIFEDRERNRREQVILPHDAMINTERDPEMRTYFLLAGFHGGTYEYTKKFFVPEEAKNQRWILEFEAVYCMSTVSVNGREVCEKPYGFTPFQIELNPHLRYGEENTVRAVANVPKEGHGRWYTGGGIYRPVNLYIGEDAYVELNGVKVTTLSIHPARIRVDLKLHGDGEIQLDILHKGEKAAEAAARIEGEAMSMELEIPDAKLWSAGTPELYEAVVTLRKDGRICDRVTESFGIRTVAVDPARGLLINGKPEFLRGGCIHNDKGVIGVINNDATELHRAKKIKEAGFNAIRSAHHPMSRSLMKACDEVGLYVMDEAFDYWFRPKGGNPYGGLFEQEFPEDTRAMVEDAYNHPSVILYSIGNEIPEAGGVKGVRIGKQILEIIRSLDTTRLMTMCPSVHWLREYLEGTPYLEEDEDEWMAKDPANQEQDWKHYMRIFMGAAANLPDNEKGQKYPESYVKMDEEATKNLYPCLDVAGYNYYEDRYETLHRLHPERVLLGTETRCTMLVDTMRFAKEHPYVIGDFVWTLQDHLGEANCGNLYYETGEETSPDSERNKKAYPWLVNYGGVIDLNGTILPAIHRYEFAWGAYTGKEKRGLYLASQPPVHNGVAPNCESYRWTDTVDGWTYEGLEGNPTWVDAYTDADSVELYLNGRKAGGAKVKDYFAKIPCIYEPGELLGIAYDKEHREVYRTNVSTAGKETVITAVPDKRVLKAGGQDFAFIDICLTDREGTIKLLPERELFIRTEGAGTLQGFGSAYHRNEEKYNQDHHQTYLGRLQAVIRSSAEKGSVRVFLSGEGVEETAVDLECV